ncbi:hypothetical protein [Comamonas trifloxystrobinivorans]|uniref:hypothetical protein n=1 Tax=Comamonas trifloxystrobinivorans TaxID=3350256 RepID=UPI003D6633B1
MTNDLTPGSAEKDATGLDPCSRNGAAYALGNAAFCRHHMSRLLHRIGVALPRLLDGQDLIRECRAIEHRCWRELGYEKQPIFDGDLPGFLMVNADGHHVDLSIPADPVELASGLAALEPSQPQTESCIGTNLDKLARLLNFTPFELQWLLWSYCIRSFGRAILPAIPLRDATYGCDVLALLCDMPIDAVRDAMASRRLHTWGFLNGIDSDGSMPSLLSDCLLATDQFADWIEQPYASDSDLLTALCLAQVSLPASR